LIIFDLDDTLIDTSGSVTPQKLKACLMRLKAEGLRFGDFARTLEELTALNKRCLKTKDALQQFVDAQGGEPRHLKAALDELVAPLPVDFKIPTTPHAKEILEYVGKNHILALVTGGHPPFQREKLEKAGIEPSIFSKIAIPEDSIKKPYYEGLLREFSIPPNQAWVCGDRIAMDLVPAYELGLKTVHMRWGRGANIQTEKWIHHSINDLGELKGIIK
jgi:putative hydrolase of the HAD superfamily